VRRGHVVAIVAIAILIGMIANLSAHLVVTSIDAFAKRPWLRHAIQILLLAVEVVLLAIVLSRTVR